MTDRRLGLIPIGGALLAPLVTWFPMVAYRYGLGLPRYDAARGIDIWHLQIFWLAIFCLVAVVVGQRDIWLGAAVIVMGLGIALYGGTFDITHRIIFLAGTLALWAMRHIPLEWHPAVRSCLAASGIFQAVYMLQQWMGYDVLWGPLVGGQLKDVIQPLGTLGTVDAASAYVAVTAPLMPVWALPIAIGVVCKGHSIGAIIALVVGLLIRYHISWKITGAVAALVVAAYVKWFMFTPDWAHVPTSVKVRLAVWWFAIKDLFANGLIHGRYSWANHIPQLQMQTGYRPYTNEVWMEAHNEYLQWFYEYGLVGLAVLVLWVRQHRAMFRDAAVGASLCALAIVSGSFFTFHVVSVALLGLALVALATPLDSTMEA